LKISIFSESLKDICLVMLLSLVGLLSDSLRESCRI